VNFLQNHDQVGNRAFGERITMLAPEAVLLCVTSILLLAPQPPLLFMGQEYGAATPFQFFCDFGAELAAAVARGRREEFARFAGFGDAAARASIPDPNDEATFTRSRLDWHELAEVRHAAWYGYYTELLALRHRHVVPMLARLPGHSGRACVFADTAFEVTWRSPDGSRLTLIANLGETLLAPRPMPPGEPIHATPENADPAAGLDAWSAHWYLDAA
jgi:1,4-alpha-glucan branching enzyme